MIRGSANPAEAKELLMDSLSLSDIQAQAILDMRLQRLTGLERDKILAEYREVIKEIARLKAILASEELVRQIIRDETDGAGGRLWRRAPHRDRGHRPARSTWRT